jgi:tRNA threonylcarbamoyladenosine biosynthesis protein TsaB
MIVLGVNTSSQISTVGLARDGVIVSELTMDMHWSWLSELSPLLEEVARRGNIELRDVDLLSIVLGPGTWTGLRIGVTTIKTLAYALGRSVVGVCALDVLAYNLRFMDKPVYSLIDAGNNRVYLAGYRCSSHIPEQFVEYQVASVDALADHLDGPCILVGDGCTRYRAALVDMLGDRAVLAPPSLCTIRAECLIEAATHLHARRGPDDLFALAPLYLQETVYRANPGTMLNLTKV